MGRAGEGGDGARQQIRGDALGFFGSDESADGDDLEDAAFGCEHDGELGRAAGTWFFPATR